MKAKFIWIIDYQSDKWIYAPNAYYVLGSTVTGPMGKEAFPFVSSAEAMQFSTAHSGKILRFKSVTIEQLMS